MNTIGHAGALRGLERTLPGGEVKAVAMATVISTSLYCGRQGLQRDAKYLVALLRGGLLILRPLRLPDPAAAVVLEFSKGTYRVTDVQVGKLNTSFVVARPYGNVSLRVSRSASYAVNDEVVDLFVAAARPAERAATRTSAEPLHAAGDVRVFSRMCAAFGPGAEAATAVAEAEIDASTARKGLFERRRPALLLATFPDRLVLLDPTATTHVGSTPIAEFDRGTNVTITESSSEHLNVALSGAGRTATVRVTRYGVDRIDDALRDALATFAGTVPPAID